MGVRFRFFLLGIAAAAALGVASAARAAGQALIVTPPPYDCCAAEAFTVQTLDGTVVSSVPVPIGAEPMAYAPAANGSIVYDDASQSTGDFGPVWLVNANQAPVELDPSPDDFDASISYDGSKVTFARFDPITWSSDIYVVNSDGSGLTLVAAGQGDSYLSSPEFSPNGGSIAYACREATQGPGMGLGCGPTMEGTYRESGVMLVNADGSDKRMILVGAGSAVDPIDSLSWSPDGQWLALTGCVQTEVNNVYSCGPDQVFAYRTDGSDLFNNLDPSRQVTHETTSGVFWPRFIPDGTKILFRQVVNNQWVLKTIDRDGTNESVVATSTTGRFEVVPPATGGGPRPTVNVTKPVPGPGGAVAVRSWIDECRGYLFLNASRAFTGCASIPAGADGVAYSAAADSSVVFSDGNHGQVGDGGPVWLSVPGKSAVELDSSPYDFDPSISYDGVKVTFARYDPATKASDIYVVDSNGSGLKLVASGGGVNSLSSPKFSPDGQSIAYACSVAQVGLGPACGPLSGGGSASSGVMLMNADGSDKRMILDKESGPLSWSPDGHWLTLSVCLNTASPCNDQIFAYHTDGSDLFNGLDPSRQITHFASFVGATLPEFSPDGHEILFLRTVDDSGSQGNFSYLINRDGTGEHEVFLTPDPRTCVPAFCNLFPASGDYVPPATGGGPLPTVKPTQATVPNLRALSLSTAKRRLAAVRLKAKVTRRSYSLRIRRGRVISQFPRARSQARLTKKQARVVKLILSRGRRPKVRR